MRTRTLSDGYQGEDFFGGVTIGGDTVLNGSVDGQGGTIRDKPVFTIEQAAYYLNRGDGVFTVDGVSYNSGANWDGAQGTANNQWYWEAVSKNNGGEAAYYSLGGSGATGPLTTINFGFYESLATLPDPYVYTRLSDGTNAKYIGFAVAQGFSAFDADQRDAARQALSAWDELINVKIVETDAAHGDINFMNTTTGPAQASAYLPYDYGRTSIVQDDGSYVTYAEIAGDVYVNPNQASNHLFDEGQYGLTTLIHETGHALGLEHPGAYNFGPGFDVTYENGAEYYQDSYQYSIMSYWGGEETGMQQVDWNNLTYRYNSTPGVHDIAAIQRIYGADYTTRNGNDTYGFNTNLSTHGLNDDSYDFVKTPAPVIAIWDGGGNNDTLDLSGYNTPSIIDLNPGAFSSAGGTVDFLTLEQINANRAAQGLAPRDQATYDLYNQLFKDTYGLTDGLMHDNIGIAYGVTIENAIGGGGNDQIKGNSVANKLVGNGGNDVISGGDGTDLITLGAGADKFIAEVNSNKVNSKIGTMSFDVVTDFDGTTDKIDFGTLDANSKVSGDQAFAWVGTSANKDAGALSYKVYDSMNGAEKALGIDIHSTSGSYDGKITVVMANFDGGSVDHAVVLLGAPTLDATDFVL